MYVPSHCPLQTKRVVLAHVLVCRGCCCGAVGKGKPEVPVEWMKNEWKKRDLKGSIQLTISGCLGPCDLSNVLAISSAAGTVWLGGVHDFRTYGAVLQWASASRGAGQVLPLPAELGVFRFNPFQLVSSGALLVLNDEEDGTAWGRQKSP